MTEPKNGVVGNRRVFYDFTFSPPKSVSIAAFIGKGVRIFTSDKVQLRENIVRADDRTLAMDLADREFVRRLDIKSGQVAHHRL